MRPLLPVRRAAGQGALVLALLALAGSAAAASRHRTVVEEMVAETNPCASLRTEVGGQAIGLDALDDVEVRTAEAALDGDALTLSLTGRLSCRTPEGALFQGDAASDVDAHAALSLADCDAAEVRVRLSDFGGSFAGLLEALQPTIEQRLAAAARPHLVAACRDFRGS